MGMSVILPIISRFAITAVVMALSMSYAAALDESGILESNQEQDEYIIVNLKNFAAEMSSQTPMQLDEYTRIMSVIAIQKTITFDVQIINSKASQLDPSRVSQVAKENINRTVCKVKETRDLIDLGVQYVYLFSGNDGVFVTRVVIDKYGC